MRYGVRDITDVVFKTRTRMRIGKQIFQAGQPIMYLDTAKTATIEGTATQVYAQGGHGNPRLVSWEGERVCTLTIEDALITPEGFSILSGAIRSDAAEDNKVKVGTWFELPIQEGGVVEIDLDTAGDDHDIYVDSEFPMFGVILDDAGSVSIHCGEPSGFAGVEPDCNVYTVTRENKLQITFPRAAQYVGRTMRIDCYAVKNSGVTVLDVTAEDFFGNFYVEAHTFYREQATGVDFPVEIVFPNVNVQSNFTISMANTGDPSTFTFTMDCFPGYVKGDYSKKVFFSQRMINKDVDTLVESDAAVCPELAFAFDSVTAGADGWDVTTLDGDPKAIDFVNLGRNLKATVDRASIDFSGTLRYVPGWDAFSSKEEELTGYYFPVEFKAEDGAKLTLTTPDGTEKELVFGETGDGEGTIHMVYAVNPDAEVVTAKLESADGSKSTTYALDFSAVSFSNSSYRS